MKKALLALLVVAFQAGAAQTVRAADGFPAVVETVRRGTVMIEAGNDRTLHFGTGFFLDSPEVVITAMHVIDGARRIRVALPGSFVTSDALLIGTVPRWDIAALKVDWPEEMDFPGLRLAPEKGDLPVGTEIAYTGYGFGIDKEFAKVLTTYRGIISGHVPYGGDYFYHLSGFVSSGLSGCPLYLPQTGEVVGVVTRQFGPDGLGIGFGGAVPAAVLRRLLDGILGN